ncbi:MAG: response regulator [Candidatus Binatia bacterium]
MERRAKAARREGRDGGSPSSPKLVIIADDDETMRIVLQRALQHCGHLALPVDDGGEIWPILERERVAALILDLNMPGVNGWEVLRQLGDPLSSRAKNFPVIVVSGQSDPETREFALRLGADAFFAKPVDLDELVAVIPPPRASPP